MQEYYKDKGAYVGYYSIPNGQEDKYEWIHSPGGGMGHYGTVKEVFYRKKTDAEINEDKQKINEIPAGTVIRDRNYLDTIPKVLHKYISIEVEPRSGLEPKLGIPKEKQREIITLEQKNTNKMYTYWVILNYIRNDIPVEVSGGRRRGMKKTRNNRRNLQRSSSRKRKFKKTLSLNHN